MNNDYLNTKITCLCARTRWQRSHKKCMNVGNFQAMCFKAIFVLGQINWLDNCTSNIPKIVILPRHSPDNITNKFLERILVRVQIIYLCRSDRLQNLSKKTIEIARSFFHSNCKKLTEIPLVRYALFRAHRSWKFIPDYGRKRNVNTKNINRGRV